jgi:hypothetical protein
MGFRIGKNKLWEIHCGVLIKGASIVRMWKRFWPVAIPPLIAWIWQVPALKIVGEFET